ncbi:MAG: 3-keto-disaccharide hydrolase, partial [Planctomycetota bacterium]
WRPANWILDFDGNGPHLWTERSYGDFVLICDWRWKAQPTDTPRPVILPTGEVQRTEDGAEVTQVVPDAGDSGILLRGSQKSQVNIWCWPVGSGEVWGYRTDGSMPPEVKAAVTPRVNADAEIGRWNRFVITMKGDRLTVVLNGQTVIENAELPGVPASGPIGLQRHGSPIQFANLYVKELR